ncbi:MAG: LTA synthase family protein [Clostridiales bacterium]|nr:LTA synthase family protein [Clostridiales bacterium]
MAQDTTGPLADNETPADARKTKEGPSRCGSTRKERTFPTVTLTKPRGDVLFLLILPLVALALFESMARGGFPAFLDWIRRKPLFFLQNLGFFFGIFWILALMRDDRARLVTSLSMLLLLCTLGLVSFYKIRYRFEPILLSDIWLLNEVPHAMGQLDLKIDWRQAARAVGLCSASILLSLVFVRGRRQKRSFLWPTLGLALICAFVPACSFDRITQGGNTDLADCAYHGGTLFTMVAAERQRQSIATFSYEETEVDRALQRVQQSVETEAKAQAAAAESPNVIVILAESFMDQQHLGMYLDFTRPLMPFYNELIQTCATGEIYVPKQGGGTSETEFEVLTGLQSCYSVNPYSIGIPPLHSLAAVFREKGYHSSAIHWFQGIFYNRYKNLYLLGFDEFYTTDTTRREFAKTGMFVSDSEHYRAVLDKLTDTQGKDFVFCITMQNHGTYEYDDFTLTYGADRPFTNNLSQEADRVFRNYCYLLGRSDEALRELIEELERFAEPTVVVFFGDHIPPFGIEVYEEIGMPTEGDAGHLTPYFIWSNRGKFEDQPPMKAWQLGAHVLSLTGVSDDPFLLYIEKLRREGINTDADYDLLSHDALFGKQRAYALAGIKPESPHWQIGGKMELIGFDTFPVDGTVYVLPRLADPTQNFRLAVNGQSLNDWHVLDTQEPFTLQCVMTSPEGKQLNHSQSITFSSTQELLDGSRRLDPPALELEQVPFHVEKEEGDFLLAVSDQSYQALASCLTLDGKRQQWQFPYGFAKSGQYYVARELEPIRVFISKESFEGYAPDPSGLAAYFREHQAMLWIFQ